MNLKENYTPADLETELLKANDLCSKRGTDFVEAKKYYEKYEDYKKIKFALLAEKLEGTLAAKEKAVLCSPEWLKYIKGLHSARSSYLFAQKEYDDAIRDYETCRSLLSSKNTERRTCI